MTVSQWLEALQSARHPRAFATTTASEDEVLRATLLSPQYGEFLRRYGAIRAFPRGRAIGLFVYASPTITTYGGKTLHEIANEDGSPRHLSEGEAAVYGVMDGELWTVAADFETWLLEAMTRLRTSYDRREWNALLKGARPFTRQEQAVIEARRKFEVVLEGIEPDERLRLRIRNGSERTLPCLTYGVRAPDLIGALFLNVADLAPGQTKTICVHAYRDQVDPRAIELHLDEPAPEDRAEFRELQRES